VPPSQGRGYQLTPGADANAAALALVLLVPLVQRLAHDGPRRGEQTLE
jgi:hypothetical protein